ncbi:MAG: ROK family protein [bacterium]|nr:ROK family protein [bacterium]
MTSSPDLASLTAQHNRALILNAVRSRESLSRTQLRQATRIRLASITELVRRLLDDGLLMDAGTGGTGRGRKHLLLKLNPGYGHAVGVEFDADHVIGVVVDLEMNVVATEEAPLFATGGRDAVLAQLTGCIRRVMSKAGVGLHNTIGIGVGDPGLVDPESGVAVLSSTIHGWHDVPVRAILEETFSVPVLMEENTRAKTLAEKRFGAGQNAGHLMFIEIGPGIGCGVMTPRGLYRGAGGAACELGHTHVADSAQVCRCGGCGCLEAVASLPAIARRAVQAMEAGALSVALDLAGGSADNLRAEHVFEAARQGDRLALRLLDETCTYLGVGIANAVNLFNPELVVFDPRLQPVQDLMLEPIRNVVMRQALQVATRSLEFSVSPLGRESGALGVAAMMVDTVFKIPQLPVPDFAQPAGMERSQS